jgi:hypothetical protein
MVDCIAAQANWFVPELVRLLNSPAAALLPVAPVGSYMASDVVADAEDPPWARLWTKAEAQAEARSGAGVYPTIAITEEDFRLSGELVSDRYAWRGYRCDAREAGGGQEQREVTLMAWSKDNAVVGTMTLGFDGGCGLLADRTHAAELGAIRGRDQELCEISRFAVASEADSKATITGLFDLSYVLGRKMLGATDVVVEVNPRHVGFYRRAFGFEPISEVRTCERVNAPAVLLRLDVSRLEGRMREVGALTPGQLTRPGN